MARWIKTNGTEQQVRPKRPGGEFTLEELRGYIGGPLGGITLTNDSQGLYMYLDEDGAHKPFNKKATEVLHQYRKDHQRTQIYGDALITDLSESGNE